MQVRIERANNLVYLRTKYKLDFEKARNSVSNFRDWLKLWLYHFFILVCFFLMDLPVNVWYYLGVISYPLYCVLVGARDVASSVGDKLASTYFYIRLWSGLHNHFWKIVGASFALFAGIGLLVVLIRDRKKEGRKVRREGLGEWCHTHFNNVMRVSFIPKFVFDGINLAKMFKDKYLWSFMKQSVYVYMNPDWLLEETRVARGVTKTGLLCEFDVDSSLTVRQLNSLGYGIVHFDNGQRSVFIDRNCELTVNSICNKDTRYCIVPISFKGSALPAGPALHLPLEFYTKEGLGDSDVNTPVVEVIPAVEKILFKDKGKEKEKHDEERVDIGAMIANFKLLRFKIEDVCFCSIYLEEQIDLFTSGLDFEDDICADLCSALMTHNMYIQSKVRENDVVWENYSIKEVMLQILPLINDLYEQMLKTQDYFEIPKKENRNGFGYQPLTEVQQSEKYLADRPKSLSNADKGVYKLRLYWDKVFGYCKSHRTACMIVVLPTLLIAFGVVIYFYNKNYSPKLGKKAKSNFDKRGGRKEGKPSDVYDAKDSEKFVSYVILDSKDSSKPLTLAKSWVDWDATRLEKRKVISDGEEAYALITCASGTPILKRIVDHYRGRPKKFNVESRKEFFPLVKESVAHFSSEAIKFVHAVYFGTPHGVKNYEMTVHFSGGCMIMTKHDYNRMSENKDKLLLHYLGNYVSFKLKPFAAKQIGKDLVAVMKPDSLKHVKEVAHLPMKENVAVPMWICGYQLSSQSKRWEMFISATTAIRTGNTITYQAAHAPGLCGAILIYDTQGYCVAGVHIRGARDNRKFDDCVASAVHNVIVSDGMYEIETDLRNELLNQGNVSSAETSLLPFGSTTVSS